MNQTEDPQPDSALKECFSAVSAQVEVDGGRLSDEDVYVVNLWCQQGVAPEFILEYLKQSTRWFICAKVSSLLGRALSDEEKNSVLDLYEKGYCASEIAYKIDPNFDSNVDVSRPVG